MKKLVFVLGLGLVFAACGDNAKENEAIETPAPIIEEIEVQEITVPQTDTSNESTDETKDEAADSQTEQSQIDEK